MVAVHRLVSSPRPHERLAPRASRVGDHVHVGLRRVWEEQAAPFLAALTDTLGDLPVAWVDARLVDGVLVVALEDPEAAGGVVRAVEVAEARAGIDANPFPEHRHGAPVEDEPLLRAAAEVAADVFALGLGATLRVLRVPGIPPELDAEVLTSLVQNVPGLRRTLAGWMGRARAEVAAGAATAFAQGLAQNLLGPVVGCAYHALRFGELRARQEAWLAAEPTLYGPGGATASPLPPADSERPVPRPAGPVERSAEMTWLASLATFVATLPLTGNADRALSVLATGAPKAARLGREAFASHVGRDLGRRGVVVVRPGSLRLLDRIDTVVVDGRLWSGGAADALARAVVASQLDLVIAGAPRRRPRATPAGTEPRVIPAASALGEVRRLQIAGRVVATVGGPSFRTMPVGDVVLGVADGDGRVADGSHIACPAGVHDASRVIRACLPARQASRESATLSVAGAIGGALLAMAPLIGSRPRRALTAVDAAALVAVGNGVRRARRTERDEGEAEAASPPEPAVPMPILTGGAPGDGQRA